MESTPAHGCGAPWILRGIYPVLCLDTFRFRPVLECSNCNWLIFLSLRPWAMGILKYLIMAKGSLGENIWVKTSVGLVRISEAKVFPKAGPRFSQAFWGKGFSVIERDWEVIDPVLRSCHTGCTQIQSPQSAETWCLGMYDLVVYLQKLWPGGKPTFATNFHSDMEQVITPFSQSTTVNTYCVPCPGDADKNHIWWAPFRAHCLAGIMKRKSKEML